MISRIKAHFVQYFPLMKAILVLGACSLHVVVLSRDNYRRDVATPRWKVKEWEIKSGGFCNGFYNWHRNKSCMASSQWPEWHSTTFLGGSTPHLQCNPKKKKKASHALKIILENNLYDSRMFKPYKLTYTKKNREI